jgi:hypothetical protein
MPPEIWLVDFLLNLPAAKSLLVLADLDFWKSDSLPVMFWLDE